MVQDPPVIGRPRRTRSEIVAILLEYRASKMTSVKFCAARQLHRPTFKRWIARYRTGQQKPAGSPAFAPLQVTAWAGPALFAEVNGVKIYQPVSAGFLKLLMK